MFIHEQRQRRAVRANVHNTQAAMDATLEDSFPASDPPSWTATIARPALRHAANGNPRSIPVDRRVKGERHESNNPAHASGVRAVAAPGAHHPAGGETVER